jgi:hypothetical protein
MALAGKFVPSGVEPVAVTIFNVVVSVGGLGVGVGVGEVPNSDSSNFFMRAS